MSDSPHVEYTQNALFQDIPRDVLENAEIIVEEISLTPGSVIFEEGDLPDYCYLVGSGAVRITKSLLSGQEELLTVIDAGDFFGELALYDSSPRSARAVAAVPTRLGRIDQKGFECLRRDAPLQLSTTLANRSIMRVRRTNTLLINQLDQSGRLSQVGHELSTLSHNLRSPLATIRNAADMLGEWIGSEHQDTVQLLRFVEIIRGTADRGLEHIDQLMARLRGEPTLQRTPTSVKALLGELREQTQGLFTKPHIRYLDEDFGFHGEVPVYRREMVAALENLVKNAVEALPPKGGNVGVSVAEDADRVVFSVADTGCGIAPEHRARLFDVGVTIGKAGGTGLGLAHVRAIARMHGGDVDYETEVGRGTVFHLWIPLSMD